MLEDFVDILGIETPAVIGQVPVKSLKLKHLIFIRQSCLSAFAILQPKVYYLHS